jgi:hypothetical protein
MWYACTRRGMHIGLWETSTRRPLGRPRCRWTNNIEIILKKPDGGVVGSVTDSPNSGEGHS